jgi:multiple antibiotic resistance protein
VLQAPFVSTAALAFFSKCFPSLLSIVDPMALVPIYLGMVGNEPRAEQRSIAVRATVTMTIVLMTFATGGEVLFHFFGITIPAFKIAGGVLLFFNALEMIHAKTTETRATAEEKSEAKEKADVAIIPIGIPLLSGPGAIATATMWSTRAATFADRLALYASIGAVAVLTLVALFFASGVVRFFKQTGINIATRIMGLILAATAAQFVVDGVRGVLHG